jgi:AcrR family transcriptional regulator
MAIGRPREFDIDQAIAIALKIFIAKGYEGASTSELSVAMGINPPSFYAAFGNKEGLFRKAVALHATAADAVMAQALIEPTSRAVVARFMRGNAEILTDPAKPPGCLFVQGALSCSDAARSIREELTHMRLSPEPILRRRFEQALTEHDLPPRSDPGKLARYVLSLTQGMAVQAASGASREALSEIIDVALEAWPKPRRERANKAPAGD